MFFKKKENEINATKNRFFIIVILDGLVTYLLNQMTELKKVTIEIKL